MIIFYIYGYENWKKNLLSHIIQHTFLIKTNDIFSVTDDWALSNEFI